VHATGSAQRVSPGDRLVDPPERRYRKAGADRVAGAQQGTEVGAVHRPQRCSDQMSPTPAGAGSARGPQVLTGPDSNRGAHRGAADRLHTFMDIRLGTSRRTRAIGEQLHHGQGSRGRSYLPHRSARRCGARAGPDGLTPPVCRAEHLRKSGRSHSIDRFRGGCWSGGRPRGGRRRWTLRRGRSRLERCAGLAHPLG
jgi:hypothetical protein